MSFTNTGRTAKKKNTIVTVKTREAFLSNVQERRDVEQICAAVGCRTVIEPNQYMITRLRKDWEGNYNFFFRRFLKLFAPQSGSLFRWGC